MKESTPAVSRKVAVLDTSAFIAGFDPFSVGGEHYTVPNVKEEIAETSFSALRFETAAASGTLRVVNPSESSLSKAKNAATTVGDKFLLSETDLQVLALALELKMAGYSPFVVTDDYSMQNVANQMNIEFASLATYGIKGRWKWMRYCPACYKAYSSDSAAKECTVCGTELKRKPLRKTRIARSPFEGAKP